MNLKIEIFSQSAK